MSNIEITLAQITYEGLYQALGAITGLGAATAATTIQELIGTQVRAGVTTVDDKDVMPHTITISVERKVLDALYVGLQDLLRKDKITVTDLLQIKSIAAILKMRNRIENYISAEFAKLNIVNDEAFDSDIIAEPFDN